MPSKQKKQAARTYPRKETKRRLVRGGPRRRKLHEFPPRRAA
jgi:hypothetical protein